MKIREEIKTPKFSWIWLLPTNINSEAEEKPLKMGFSIYVFGEHVDLKGTMGCPKGDVQ